MLRAGSAIFALFRHIRVGAGQPREIPEHGQLRARFMVGDEDRETHVGAGRVAPVPVDALRAAVAADGRDGFESHRGSCIGMGAVRGSWPQWRSRSSIAAPRSEEHTSELQSLMRISYAVFCLKKKK